MKTLGGGLGVFLIIFLLRLPIAENKYGGVLDLNPTPENGVILCVKAVSGR